MTDVSNPYAAPKSELASPWSRPRLHVGHIPAVLCGVPGVLLIAFALFFGSLVAIDVFNRFMPASPRHIHDPVVFGRPLAPSPLSLAFLSLYLFAGIFGLLAAWAWVREKWRPAGMLTAIAGGLVYLISVFAPSFLR